MIFMISFALILKNNASNDRNDYSVCLEVEEVKKHEASKSRRPKFGPLIRQVHRIQFIVQIKIFPPHL